ncbi:MAG: dynamin family protein, partial [Actinomycetota bacterium]|nr:dynamin family protein [Actinomycetota bacterium]
RTRERLTALLAQADPDGAAWVEEIRTARPDVPTVVVVGETSRGKSSLVNALLATPGLSPVDADVATARYLVMRHGPQWAARACYPGAAPPVAVSMGELVDWVSATAELPEGQVPPRYLEIAGPVPLLERFTLVDTPGVGGLDEVHGELAAEAAAGATALLFVLDAAAPITRGELEFLTRLGGRVETVLFALTKTDLHRGWRQILDANRDALARHAPRFADAEFHPVSARLAEKATGAPCVEVAALLRERSGIAALQTALQHQVTGRAAMLGEANVLRALATALDGLAVRLEAEQRALDGVGAAHASAAALRVRRDELATARRSSTRSWQLRLRGEIQRARVESTHDVAGRVRTAQMQLRSGIDAAGHGQLEQLPHHVDATLQAIAVHVSAGLAHRVARVADRALADLFTPDELAAIRAQLARHPRLPVVQRPPDVRPDTAETKLLVAMGFSGGLGIGRLAALPLAGLGAAAGAVVLPVSIVLGLGAGWWMARTRRHAMDRQHLKQWLVDVLAEARSMLDQAVAEQMIDAEQQLSLALDDALDRRLAAIEDELREVDRAMRMDAAERNAALDSVRSRLTEVRAGQGELTALLRHIGDLRDRSG